MVDFTSLPCELGPIGELPSPAEPIDGGSIDGPIITGETPIGPFEPAPDPYPVPGEGGDSGGGGTGGGQGPSTNPFPFPGPVTPSPGPGPVTGGGGGGGGSSGPSTNPFPFPGPITPAPSPFPTSGAGSTGGTGGQTGPTTDPFPPKEPSVVVNNSASEVGGYEYENYSSPESFNLGVDDTYYNTYKEASQSNLIEDSVLTSVFNTLRDDRINNLIRETQLTISQINEFTASISTTTLKDSLRSDVRDVLFGLHTPDGRPYPASLIKSMLKNRISDSTISEMDVDYILSLRARSVFKGSPNKQQISFIQRSEFGRSKRELNLARTFVANTRVIPDPPIIPNQTRAMLRARQKRKSLNPYQYEDLNKELLKLWYILPTDIYRRLEVVSNNSSLVPVYINNDDSISVETSSGAVTTLPVSPYVYQLPVVDTSGNIHYIDTNSDISRAVTLPNITEQACLFDAGSEYRTTLDVGIPGGCKALDVETTSGTIDIEVCNNSLIVQTSGGLESITTLTNFLVVDTSGPDGFVPIHDMGNLEFTMETSSTPDTFYLLELIPASVQEVNTGSTILNRKSTARYRLITEPDSYIQDMIEFRVYPWKVFPINYSDPILGYFKFSSNFDFTFNTFSLKKFGENHGEPIFVRRIPKIIVVVPTNRTSYDFFHAQSQLIDPNLRRIDFGALPEPDYYNTGLDKHWLRIRDQYPDLDIYGEVNPNAKSGEYNPDSTLLNSGMTQELTPFRHGFRAAYDIANYLADTYYLDGGLLWSDIFVRMTQEEYVTYNRGIPEELLNAFMNGDYTGVKVFHNSVDNFSLQTRLLGLKPGKTDTMPFMLIKEAV